MLERTVEFDGRNSWLDYNIIFETFTNTPPEPNLVLIDIPYRNGSLDESDYFGDITYKDRTLSMTFLIPYNVDDLHGIYSRVLNELHGKRRKIVISADENWYYEGRLSVGDLSNQSEFWGFSITATVDPYKYRDVRAIYNIREVGQTINIYNDIMKTVPEIISNKDIDLRFNNKTLHFTKNARIVDPDWILKPGNNIFTVISFIEGTAIQVSYREGRL